MTGGPRGAILTLVALLIASPLVAPQLLAFPHKAHSGSSIVWSEKPIDPVFLDRIIARSEALVAASPIAREPEPRRIFLTDGGWRWSWLAATSRGSFALTRALTDPVVIVNRHDVTSDTVSNGRAVGGTRSLSSVLAHETTHGMLRRHFGIWALVEAPNWAIEGYCDHIARESTLSARQAALLKARGEDHPALIYFHGRRRVAAILDANGGNVDALLRGID